MAKQTTKARPLRKGAGEKPTTPRPGFPGTPVAKAGPVLVISTVTVLEIKALQDEKRTLEKKLEQVTATLKEKEGPVIEALERGVSLEPGCPPCAVKLEERRTPRWKEIACRLAEKFLSLKPEVYEAQVLTETEAKVYKRLIVNGNGSR